MSFLVPQRNDALVIRRAQSADAGAIGRVQVQTWREAYQGIIPPSYLHQLSVAAHERQWRRTFADGGWAFVAEWEERIVGFGSGNVDLDGFRLGAGLQYLIGNGGYVGAEYRYSNYEQDFTRNQIVATFGYRF